MKLLAVLLLVAVAAVSAAPGFYPGLYPGIVPNIYTNLLLKKAAIGLYTPFKSPFAFLANSHLSAPTLTIHRKLKVPVLKPHPVFVDKPVPFVVKKKVPVFYDAPYPVKVVEPVNYYVDKPVHYPVDAPYHVPIPKEGFSLGEPLTLQEPLDVNLAPEGFPSFPQDVHLGKKK